MAAGLELGIGVAEKVLVAWGLAAGLAVGLGAAWGLEAGLAPGWLALAMRTCPDPRTFCLSSVWKVPLSGLKTSSLVKLGPTGLGAAPEGCSPSKVRAGREDCCWRLPPRAKSPSSESKSKLFGLAAEGLGRAAGRRSGRGVGESGAGSAAASSWPSARRTRLRRADPPAAAGRRRPERAGSRGRERTGAAASPWGRAWTRTRWRWRRAASGISSSVSWTA